MEAKKIYVTLKKVEGVVEEEGERWREMFELVNFKYKKRKKYFFEQRVIANNRRK